MIKPLLIKKNYKRIQETKVALHRRRLKWIRHILKHSCTLRDVLGGTSINQEKTSKTTNKPIILDNINQETGL